MSGSNGFLVISRDRSISNALRGFTILIDDRAIDKIRSGETKKFALPPGRYAVRVAIDLYKSRPLDIDLAPGQTLSLSCGDRAPKTLGESFTLRGIGQSLTAITSPADYLYVERDASEAAPAAPVDTAPKAVPARPSSTARTRTGRTIFLSYRREDSRTITGRICDHLINHFGKQAVFRDVDSIPAGADFRRKIQETIDQADVLLVVIGPGWLEAHDRQGQPRLGHADDFVRLEIESALASEIPVIPLLVEGANMPRADQLPESIAELAFRNALPIPQEPFFHAGVDMLIEQIEALSGEPAKPQRQYCIGCGRPLEPNQRFCTNCGRPFAST